MEGGTQMEFEEKDKVQHKLTKDWMLVLEVSDNSVLCRTKDYREISFKPWELEKV